jgi:hypothetical protein
VHVAVAGYIGDDRGRRDRGALLVAVDDGAMRRREGAELEPVDQAHLSGLAGPQRLPQSAQVRAMQPVPVDHRRREHAHRHPLGRGEDGPVELLALLGPALLGVVQERERPYAMVSQALEVEEHPGDDERARERPASRLVGSRHEPHAKTPVEREELQPGSFRHAPEDSAAPGACHRPNGVGTTTAGARGRGPSCRPCRVGSRASPG